MVCEVCATRLPKLGEQHASLMRHLGLTDPLRAICASCVDALRLPSDQGTHRLVRYRGAVFAEVRGVGFIHSDAPAALGFREDAGIRAEYACVACLGAYPRPPFTIRFDTVTDDQAVHLTPPTRGLCSTCAATHGTARVADGVAYVLHYSVEYRPFDGGFVHSDHPSVTPLYWREDTRGCWQCAECAARVQIPHDRRGPYAWMGLQEPVVVLCMACVDRVAAPPGRRGRDDVLVDGKTFRCFEGGYVRSLGLEAEQERKLSRRP